MDFSTRSSDFKAQNNFVLHFPPDESPSRRKCWFQRPGNVWFFGQRILFLSLSLSLRNLNTKWRDFDRLMSQFTWNTHTLMSLVLELQWFQAEQDLWFTPPTDVPPPPLTMPNPSWWWVVAAKEPNLYLSLFRRQNMLYHNGARVLDILTLSLISPQFLQFLLCHDHPKGVSGISLQSWDQELLVLCVRVHLLVRMQFGFKFHRGKNCVLSCEKQWRWTI